MVEFILAYLIIGTLFTLYFKDDLFQSHEDSYSLTLIAASIVCGPLSLAAWIFIAVSYFINSFIHRVFR